MGLHGRRVRVTHRSRQLACTEFCAQRNNGAAEGDGPIFADTKIGTVPRQRTVRFTHPTGRFTEIPLHWLCFKLRGRAQRPPDCRVFCNRREVLIAHRTSQRFLAYRHKYCSSRGIRGTRSRKSLRILRFASTITDVRTFRLARVTGAYLWRTVALGQVGIEGGERARKLSTEVNYA